MLGLCGLANACLVPPPADPVAGAQSAPAERVWQAQTVASRCARPQVRTWHYFARDAVVHEVLGRAFGRCDVVADAKGTRYHLRSRYELSQGDKTLRGEAELVTDAKGEILEASARADGFAWQVRRDGEALTTVLQDNLTLPPKVPLQPGDGFLGFMTPYLEEVMLATHDLALGTNQWRVISLGMGTVEPWSAEVTRSGSGLALRTSLAEAIEWKDGRLHEVALENQGLAIREAASEAWPSWTLLRAEPLVYRLPANANFVARDLEIPQHAANQPRLAGELLLPKGEKKPRPGVLLLGSSVPADRYGFAGPPAVDLGYHALADALAQAGFVVLRFDARGRGGSEAGLVSWVGDKEDAQRALAALIAAPEVDPSRIVMVGHGEGGLRALHLAHARASEVVGVALLATPAQSQAQAMAANPEVLGAIRRGTDLPAGILPHLRWLQEILDEEPLRLVAATRCRLLIVHGGKDFEIDGVQAQQELRKAALARPLADPVGFVTNLLDLQLDHLLRVEPATSSQQTYLERRPISPAVVDALVAFTKQATI